MKLPLSGHLSSRVETPLTALLGDVVVSGL